MPMDRFQLSRGTVVVVCLLCASTSFALFGQSFNVKIIPSGNGEVVDLASQTKVQMKASEAISVSLTEPKIVQLDGRIPMMIVPIKDGISEIRIDPPTIKDATAHLTQTELSNNVAEIVQGIEEVRAELRAKSYDRAMNRLQQIQAKYPKVAFLEFIKASILFLQGRKSEARSAASIGLQAHPDFEDGQKFLKSLGSDR